MKPADRILPALLLFSLLTIYGMTLAPGLTWSGRGADGGELATAAATNGVPHPSGYPTYLLLARVFQLLPIGSLAFRTNLLSALFAALAALITYRLVSRSTRNPLAGLVSAYAFGLSPLLWSQAVITEVYALHAFFVALILYWSVFSPPSLRAVFATLAPGASAGEQSPPETLRLLRREDHPPRNTCTALRLVQCRCDGFAGERTTTDLAFGLTFGLALGNHLTTIFLLPVLFRSDRHFDVRSLARRMAWLCAGLLTYLILPLRAAANPPVNWGNPVTLKGFGWLVSGQLYQDEVFALTVPALWARVQSAAALLLDQFGVIGLVLGLLGLVFYFRPSALTRNTLWTMAVYSIFAIGYATDDSFLHFIPPTLCFAVWIGIGLDGLMEFMKSQALPSLRDTVLSGAERSRRTVSKQSPHVMGGLLRREDHPPRNDGGIIDPTTLTTPRASKLAWLAGVAILIYFLFLAASHWGQVDASRDVRAEQFGKLIMTQMPADALVFAEGDQAIFSLCYFHFALRERPDLIVIATDLLHFDWYQETLKSTYPNLALRGPFPFPETIMFDNPARPACFVEYDQQAIIRCDP